jgi:predicted transcriptional regulator
MSSNDGEDAWMWDRVMQTINRYYTVSRIQLRNILVREAMIEPIVAFKNTEVSECAALMHKKRIDQVPVVTSSQKLTGMLKDSDILLALIDSCEKAD